MSAKVLTDCAIERLFEIRKCDGSAIAVRILFEIGAKFVRKLFEICSKIMRKLFEEQRESCATQEGRITIAQQGIQTHIILIRRISFIRKYQNLATLFFIRNLVNVLAMGFL